MTGSPAAGLVRAWVDLYTRGLPAELRAARCDEVADDLWCEQAEAATLGRSAGVDMALRLLFGMPADITWRLAQTRPMPAETLNRRSSMNSRALGLLALAAGVTWAVWLSAFVAIGAEIWSGGVAPWSIVAIFLGGIGFPLSAIGLAYQVQDRLGWLSALGAVMMVIGALVAMTDSTGAAPAILLLLFPLGSAILLWEVSGTGFVSRVVPIAQAATAVALSIAGVVGLPLDGGPAERATGALIFAPFVLSWIVLGVSVARGVPQPESAGRGSPA